ncbi:MAG: PilZ domain-containing protein [Planctomycetes bacterium]|nr:PilZ domain-containing protein [Planctomycetota bacterium]
MDPFQPRAGDEFATETGERRRARRLTNRGRVQLSIDTRELEGRADNVSPSGILFFSEGDLRVTVEYEENGASKTRSGRLVRAQRMRGDRCGWAVEFDPTT